MAGVILLPIDGSDHSMKAAGIAADLALVHDASITVVNVIEPRHFDTEYQRMAEVEHVVPPGETALPWLANVPDDLEALLQSRSQYEERSRILGFLSERVVQAATDVLTERGLDSDRIRFVVKNGHPAERIVETAREVAAAIIVIGSRGMSDVRGLVFGSVSHRVAHEAHCTVITVT